MLPLSVRRFGERGVLETPGNLVVVDYKVQTDPPDKGDSTVEIMEQMAQDGD